LPDARATTRPTGRPPLGNEPALEEEAARRMVLAPARGCCASAHGLRAHRADACVCRVLMSPRARVRQACCACMLAAVPPCLMCAQGPAGAAQHCMALLRCTCPCHGTSPTRAPCIAPSLPRTAGRPAASAGQHAAMKRERESAGRGRNKHRSCAPPCLDGSGSSSAPDTRSAVRLGPCVPGGLNTLLFLDSRNPGRRAVCAPRAQLALPAQLAVLLREGCSSRHAGRP
jgi:hypothetical protein